MTLFSVGNSGNKIDLHDGWYVLDVGSGHNPHRRANVLVDKYAGPDEHRSGRPLQFSARVPLVIADAEALPFRDKVFDYVIASHVAEHVANPVRFCTELIRVARAGYIETPGKIGEILLWEPIHKWFVYAVRGCLVFEKKGAGYPFRYIRNAFYALFYMNQGRLGHPTVRVRPGGPSRFLLAAVAYFVHRPWRKARRLTYTCFEWMENFPFLVRNGPGRRAVGGIASGPPNSSTAAPRSSC
jgi:SAM-dependent methyltransferase